MIDFKHIIEDIYLHHGSIQEIINRRFSSKTDFVLPMKYFKLIETHGGALFYVAGNMETIVDVLTDYTFSDIRKDDICVDIGANIGGFTLHASPKCRHVYAVEPIMTEYLRKNIELNEAINVEVCSSALSNEKYVTLNWRGIEETVPGITFRDIVDNAGGCDFLKCDCEGAEWAIPIEELSDIRAIEIEVHKWGNYNPNFIKELSKTHDIIKTPMAGAVEGIVHARIK